MYKDNRCINKNWTPEELKQELKNDMIADREIDGSTVNYSQIMTLMDRIEAMRIERRGKSSEFTQQKLAEKAGIGLSTYTDYLSGTSDNIKLKTVINIAHALQCKLSDLVDEEH